MVWVGWADGQTDRRTDKSIAVGAQRARIQRVRGVKSVELSSPILDIAMLPV